MCASKEGEVKYMARPDPKVIITAALAGAATFKNNDPNITQSCILGGHMRVGLEDNTRMPNGDLARSNWELAEVAARIAACLGRGIATPDEARQIMGLRKEG